MIGMYYSIVNIYHIHCSDKYVHVYARWVGFQMQQQLECWQRRLLLLDGSCQCQVASHGGSSTVTLAEFDYRGRGSGSVTPGPGPARGVAESQSDSWRSA